MQIKRFEARDMSSALRLIKKELGPDAVILSARNLKKENKLLGLVKSVGVEVTAAVDSFDLPVKTPSAAFSGAVSAYRQHEKAAHSRMRKLRRNPNRRSQPYLQRNQPLIGPEDNARFAAGSLLGDLFEHLLAHEVKRDVAGDIVMHLKKRPVHQPLDKIEQIIAELTNRLNKKCFPAAVRPARCTGPRIVAVVGPSGVGKTTTLTKLAARHAIERRQRVALVSLDTFRIGAAAELKVYARAMGLPFKMAATPAACAAALNEFRQFDFIFVDTPGLNPAKRDEIEALKTRLDGLGAVEIHLALSALTKESDLANAVRRLKPLAIKGLIFTKLDECCTLGSLINLLWNHPYPVSYLTDGRQVPEAIKTGSVREIVQNLLGDFKWRTADADTLKRGASRGDTHTGSSADPFVANSNSDVFHCSDCKWTRKIKPANLVTFTTAAEAQRQQFMPCRDCQPDKNQFLHRDVSVTRDSVRISNYS